MSLLSPFAEGNAKALHQPAMAAETSSPSQNKLRRTRMVALACIFIFLLSEEITQSSKAFAAETRPSRDQVESLIQQLGDESYATRRRAKESLQRIGLEAFDQLQSAQFHPDNEIALTARFLISSLNVSWSKEGDSQEVRETLQEYGGLEERDRERRIVKLASFTNRSGLAALVRITNYERSNRLRLLAAMEIMQQELLAEAENNASHGETILKTLVSNGRPANVWLHQYANDLVQNEYSASAWRKIILSHRQKLDADNEVIPNRDHLLKLVRLCAVRANGSGQQSEAISLAVENQNLIEPTTRSLIEASSWAIDHQLHPFVLELKEQHLRMFDEHPMLLYGAAEAEQIAGDPLRGEKLALQALQINPLPIPSGDEENEPSLSVQPREIEEIARMHREIANQLAQRGRFQWAERELRQMIDSLEIDSISSALARSDLSVLLADLQRHEEVAELLTPLIDRLQKDANLKQQLIRLSTFNYSFIISSAQYHTALAMMEQGNLEQARPILAQAFQRYPVNVDILISMYQTDGDETWRNLVERTLEANLRQIEQSIQDVREDAKRFGQPIRMELGYQLNQYAWLVSNTRGNKARALKYSLESLNISNDSAKMDTCARCYFALGDFENAMRMQKLALKKSPYSPPLLRQLQLIEDALEQSEAEASSPSAS